jgi:NarL family two-component system response regulator LiaR
MHERVCGGTSEDGSDRRTAVVIDRERIWRDAAAQALIRMNIDVIARADSMRAGLRILRRSRPDIVVVELSGSADDFRATEFLRGTRMLGLRRVIAFSQIEDPAAARRALAGGAVAYVVKSGELSDLGFAVRQVLHRSIYLSLDEVIDGAALDSEEPSAELLTKREREIVLLVAEGYSNAEIAQQLWVTQRTVKFHLSNTFRKLDVSGRGEVAEWARSQGVATARKREAPL